MWFPPQLWSISSLIFTLSLKKENKHPILWAPRANSHEAAKAVIQLGLFSGRYRVAMLTRHLSPSRSGTCSRLPWPGDSWTFVGLLYLLLTDKGEAQKTLEWLQSSTPHGLDTRLAWGLTHPSLQFILDASVLPSVVTLVQTYGQDIHMPIFYLSRTWCYIL